MGDTAVRTGPDDEPSRGHGDSGEPSRAHRDPVPPAASRRIHLSQREVEQVIARAVELQQDGEVGRHAGLTLDDLQAVVAQVGVEADVVRRALDDVRLGRAGTPAQGWIDRVLGPGEVVGAAVVAGDVDEVRRAIATWMTTDEGLQLAGTRDGADRWVPDKRLLTQMRHGLKMTRSDSALRGLRVVTTRSEPASDGTLVAIEADTSSIRTATTAVLAASGLAGIGAGAALAAILPDAGAIASDVAQFSLGFGFPVAVGAGVTTVIHRSWLGRVRRAVVQALDGIGMTTRVGEDAASPAVDWRAVKRQWFGGS